MIINIFYRYKFKKFKRENKKDSEFHSSQIKLKTNIKKIFF